MFSSAAILGFSAQFFITGSLFDREEPPTGSGAEASKWKQAAGPRKPSHSESQRFPAMVVRAVVVLEQQPCEVSPPWKKDTLQEAKCF